MLQPLTLGGEWQFRPKPDRVSVPYAKVSDASEVTGERLGWAASGFDDTDWPELWLNEEQNTVRQWQMIGPFQNTDNDGFAKIYPPEQEFDPHKNTTDSTDKWAGKTTMPTSRTSRRAVAGVTSRKQPKAAVSRTLAIS